jgi:hypothetical protein
MSNYAREIEDAVMEEDTDDLIMEVTFTGQEYDEGVLVWLETELEMHDGTKHTTWLAHTFMDGLLWDDGLMQG